MLYQLTTKICFLLSLFAEHIIALSYILKRWLQRRRPSLYSNQGIDLIAVFRNLIHLYFLLDKFIIENFFASDVKFTEAKINVCSFEFVLYISKKWILTFVLNRSNDFFFELKIRGNPWNTYRETSPNKFKRFGKVLEICER